VRLGNTMRRRRPSDGGGRDKSGPARSGPPGRVPRPFLLVLGFLLVGWGGGYLFAAHVVFADPETASADFRLVPDLRGLGLAEAGTLLGDRGLQIGAVDSISHPNVAPGEVLGQSPVPGQLLLPDGEIQLTLSMGPERRPVPDVVRLRADRAFTVLQATGFSVVVDSVEAEVPEGRVVSTLPDAGSVLPLPGEVRLVVSMGPPMVAMPELAGLQEEEARIVLDSLGLVVEETESRFSFGFDQGAVIEQYPPPDSLIPQGAPVRLVIGQSAP
jgi:eukaryotic-like serine/threonine-protein kinase